MRKTVAVILLLLLCQPATAQPTAPWGEVDGWLIQYDPTLSNSCFALTASEDGTALRIGFNSDDADAPLYLVLGNENWASLELGKEYNLVISLDESEWEAPATGITFGDDDGFVMLHVRTDSPLFLQEFTRKHWMRVQYNGRLIASVSLRGSFKAAQAMTECQTRGGKPSNSDPFAKPAPQAASNDPFA